MGATPPGFVGDRLNPLRMSVMMKTKIASVLLVTTFGVAGCSDDHKLAEDQQRFRDTVAAQEWELDRAFAMKVLDPDEDAAGNVRFTTWEECHGNPPKRDAGKRTCAALNARVAKAKAKADAAVKAGW
jgi:hypothetical protein